MEQAGASTVCHEDATPSCRRPEPPHPQRAFMVSSRRSQPQPLSGPRHSHSVEHPQSPQSGSGWAATRASEPWTPARNTIARAISSILSIITLILRTLLYLNNISMARLQAVPTKQHCPDEPAGRARRSHPPSFRILFFSQLCKFRHPVRNTCRTSLLRLHEGAQWGVWDGAV